MKLPHISVKRPVATAMLFLAILLFGVVSMFRLPLDLLPDLELPVLTVITPYPGASAEEVEEQVTQQIEKFLSGTADLKNITSQSKENVSFVQMEFNWGADLDNASNNARDMLEMAKMELPDGANNPIIYKFSSSNAPVIIYNVSAQESYLGLEKILEDEISSPIQKIDGVATVLFIGTPSREIKINVDPQKLKAYGLSVQGISNVLQAENVSIPGGNIKSENNDISLRVPGKFENIKAIENCALANLKGKTIYLKDVATVNDGFKDIDVFATSRFGRGVVMMVQKQSGANTVEVVHNIRDKVADLQGRLPEDLQIKELLGTDEIVVEAIRNLAMTIFWALIFVVLVVFFFLRDWRGSLIVFLTIPFSLIVSFSLMYTIGWTINIFSLISLIIALGMVVDAAIVVYENITQHVEKGEKPKLAAVFGTSEMGMAISASTATTISVFLPMIFMGGIAGILFQQLAILVSVTLLTALFTSLTLTPMVSSQLLKPLEKRKKEHGKLFKFFEKIFTAAENAYKQALNWSIGHNLIVILIVILLFGGTIYMARYVETDYLPNFDAGDLVVVFETEVGTSAEKTNRVAEKVKQIMTEEIPERVDGSLFSITGQTEEGLLTSVGFQEGKNIANIMTHLVLCNKRERSAEEIAEALRPQIEKIPEIANFHITAGSVYSSAILGSVKPIEIELTGNNLDQLNTTAEVLKGKIEKLNLLTDIQTTIDKGKQEIVFDIDRERASHLGLNAMMIASQVRHAIYGTEAGKYSDQGEEYEIRIRYSDNYRSNIDELQNIVLTNLQGEQVKISQVADLKMDTSPQLIRRKSQQRIVKVQASLNIGASLSKAAEEVQAVLDDYDGPQGVDVQLMGQVSEQGRSFGDLRLIFALGILLVYMVMAAQFESFKNPFIIMFAIPLTIIGIVWAFLLTGTTLSINSFIGAIMLIGIVVNNGIVLVDYMDLLVARGYEFYDAVLEGGRSRFRPVLMTSLTTILAMVPMATSTGMGNEMFVPIGITMIGGLLVSTFITLLFVPSLYVVFNRNKKQA